MRAMTPAALVVLGAAALLTALAVHWSDIVLWAQTEQRAMQAQLARAIQAVRTGEQLAVASLMSACLLYGLLHAIGPGHGKFLIGGAAVASRRTAWRMAAIGFSASLMQAASAILLAYGGLGLAAATGSAIIGSAQGFLIPLSFAAMALVGIWIVVRGVRIVLTQSQATAPADSSVPHTHTNASLALHGFDHNHAQHGHSGHCAAGCKHMPTVDEAERAESWRDIAALVVSIGVRPCSGALIVLIISWHFGLYLVGALATVAMAVGTGLVVGAIAVFATTVRDSGLFRLGADGGAISLASFGRLQVIAGSMVVIVCMVFIASDVSSSAPTGLVR